MYCNSAIFGVDSAYFYRYHPSWNDKSRFNKNKHTNKVEATLGNHRGTNARGGASRRVHPRGSSHAHSTWFPCPFHLPPRAQKSATTGLMRPQAEEIEDDLAAEEENKLINEVSQTYHVFVVSPRLTNGFITQEYKTWSVSSHSSAERRDFLTLNSQEEERTVSL